MTRKGIRACTHFRLMPWPVRHAHTHQRRDLPLSSACAYAPSCRSHSLCKRSTSKEALDLQHPISHLELQDSDSGFGRRRVAQCEDSMEAPAPSASSLCEAKALESRVSMRQLHDIGSLPHRGRNACEVNTSQCWLPMCHPLQSVRP